MVGSPPDSQDAIASRVPWSTPTDSGVPNSGSLLLLDPLLRLGAATSPVRATRLACSSGAPTAPSARLRFGSTSRRSASSKASVVVAAGSRRRRASARAGPCGSAPGPRRRRRRRPPARWRHRRGPGGRDRSGAELGDAGRADPALGLEVGSRLHLIHLRRGAARRRRGLVPIIGLPARGAAIRRSPRRGACPGRVGLSGAWPRARGVG